MKKRKPPISTIYQRLYDAWGPQGWWPGRTRLEVMVGAVLTQNTAWVNVEQAIRRLKREKALTLQRLHEVQTGTLAEWIRPAGYYNLKARRLKNLVEFVMTRFGGRLNRMAGEETDALRGLLLEVNGIGRETADCIVLYAFSKPRFVVDAYTRRFLLRHDWIGGEEDYDEVAGLFMDGLDRDPAVFNEYHALIVELGKRHCKTKPECHDCPLACYPYTENVDLRSSLFDHHPSKTPLDE
ncbi:MAG: hypothetical protein AAF492_17270, partial [Verrucomicrobiota bacterium]